MSTYSPTRRRPRAGLGNVDADEGLPSSATTAVCESAPFHPCVASSRPSLAASAADRSKVNTMDYFIENEGTLTPSDAVAAVIVLEDGRYLMQLRDQKPGIFYPGHWGLFGGGIDSGENPETALHRELEEELRLAASRIRYLTEFTFDYGKSGRISRYFYETRVAAASLDGLTLREGVEMRAFRASDILNRARVVPYDAFAIWLHARGAL
jgi:8-oxo-dGTP pyrophosphatase MutT (NUDIX family)